MASPAPREKGSGLRRAAVIAAWFVGVVAALLLGASLFVQTPAFRANVVARVNRALEGSGRGSITLEGLTRLGLAGAHADALRVRDEHGELVLELEDVSVGFALLEVLAPWLSSSPAGIELDHVRVDRARVRLLTDPGSGELTLARAFGKDSAASTPRTSAPLAVTLASVEVGLVELSVDHPALGRHDVRIDHVRGNAIIAGEDSEVTVQRFGVLLIENGQRWVDGTGSLRLLPRGGVGGDFHGFVRGTELDLSLLFDAGVLGGQLDVPRAMPEALGELLPGWPLRAPLAAHLTARGPLERLALTGRASSGGARVDLTGTAHLKDDAAPSALLAHLDLEAHGLDAQAIEARAPRTALDARGGLDVSRASQGLRFVADVTTDPVSVGDLRVPSVHLAGQAEAGAAAVHFEFGDTRGDVDGDLRRAPDGAVELTARLTGISLGALPELGGRVAGRVDGRARARLEGERFEGSLDGRLNGFRAGGATIASGTWRAGFSGSLAAPEAALLDVTLAGSDVALGPIRLEQALLTGHGPWHESRVEATFTGRSNARGSAHARLGLRGPLRLDDIGLDWTDRDLSLTAHAERWLPESGSVVLDRVNLAGKAGTLNGSARIAPGRVELTANAERLDPELLARTFGPSGLGVRGVVSGKLSLTSTPEAAHGELVLDGEKIRVQNLSLGALATRATLAGQHVEVDIDASDASLGRVEVRAVGELGGRPLELAAWRRATGSASLALKQLPLWPVGLWLGQTSRVKDLDGKLDLGLKVERRDAAALPDLFLQANTDALSFAIAPEGAGASPRTFAGYALHGSASIDGGAGHGAATVLVTDEHGALVTTSGSLDVDFEALLREPRTLLERLFQTPLDALVRLHPRPISELPAPFGVRDLGGSVEATLQLRGSLAKPTLSLAARGHQLQGGVVEGDRAVDVISVLDYTLETGQLRGTAEVQQNGKSLVAARVEGRVPDPLDPSFSSDRLELRAAAMLNGVPLELVPVAARERIAARLYGSVDVEKQPGEPFLQRAHLEIAGLSAQGHALGNGRLTFESRGEGLRADLRLGSAERYLRANVRGPATKAAADSPILGSLDARDFDAAGLSPLTSGLLSRLAGVITADLDFSLKPTGADWYLGIDGKAVLRDGSAHIEELGLEVREIAAEVNARSTPEYSVILINPLSAKARARSPNLKGDAELWLRGFRVVDGEANLSLDDVPLSLKGVSRGIARGHVKARLERVSDYLALEVKVPDLRVRLPASSTRSLIALEANPDLHVLQAAEQPSDDARDALLWKIQLDLGNNLRIQRGDLDVPITGHPMLEYQYDLRPSGTISALPGGRITLFSQSFTIERGLLQLVPDEPDNPRVDVTASWRAPDGTTVYVDVTGRAKDASVLTRDDRGLQEVERFYLITGGAVGDGHELATSNSVDSGALGQTFSLGINELLRNSLGNVAVSVGTTADDRASYSASVRLTDKLSFQGSFQPASETHREESTNDLTGTLDYRFSRRWSLRTELGTSGGAFDVLWSHRY